MERKPRPFDRVEHIRSTVNSKMYFTKLIEKAARADRDAQKGERIAAQNCKACWYVLRGGMVAGAAMTTQPCACCLLPQTYGSTNTDALCMPCAHQNSMCKHCGGDLDMRTQRRIWPERAPAVGQVATLDSAQKVTKNRDGDENL
jgi:hypothetical protein